MSDAGLVAAMRAGDTGAWSEFQDRFHPLLELYARRIGIPPGLIREYVDTALDDTALRLSEAVSVPHNLAGYLCRVVRNHALMATRAAMRRDRHQRDTSVYRHGEHVVPSLCSEHAIRASSGIVLTLHDGGPSQAGAPAARAALATALRARLTPDEQRLIMWVEDAVPCRDIATWLGISYDAAAKRIQRLKLKLRSLAESCAAELGEEFQRELAQWLPTIVSAEPAIPAASPAKRKEP